MIVAVDVETIGLNCTKFVLGCLKIDGEPTETYYKKQDLWNRVLELGKQCKKQRKLLTVLAHNHEYDFYAYANLEEKGINIYVETPFIADLKTNEYNIKFLDTYGIYRMSLKKAAQLIEMEKGEMPIELQMTEEFITPEVLKKIEPYCKKDTEICLELYKKALEMGRKELKLTHIYTIYQMAIATVIKELCKTNGSESLLYNRKIGCTRKTNHATFTESAHRAGPLQAFKTGKNIQGLTYIDVNSLWPYALTKTKLPDLRTERLIKEPEEIVTQKELLQKIGISRCLLYNNSDKLPFLQIRTKEESYYPKKGQYLLGTYTHIELEYAIQRGYELITIEQSLLYEEGPNHLAKIMKNLYNKRKGAGPLEDHGRSDKSSLTGSALRNYFYKQYLNGSISKFSQKQHGTSITIGHYTEIKKYLTQGYEIINDYEDSLIFQQPKKEETKPKRYYAPILAVLPKAKARIIMQEHYDKIPEKDLYYTDTDSIIFKGEHLHKFDINDEKLGAFKIEEENVEGTIYGKKSYLIGEEMKISGIRKGDNTKNQFIEGNVTNRKIIGIKSAHKINEVGTFRQDHIDLNIQQEKHQLMKREHEKEWLLIDNDIEDISYFLPFISEINNKKVVTTLYSPEQQTI